MDRPPFDVVKELRGWTLFWAKLEYVPGGENRLAECRAEVAREARASLSLESLAAHPPVAALRRLFKAAGCDPTRYRPSSEALLRRLLKGDELPALHPLVDINNCLSVRLAAPCCVMRAGSFTPPLVLRRGRPGESYESLRGPISLEDKPLLTDAQGPLDTPITGNEKVKVTAETEAAWLVVYLPEQVISAETASETLLGILQSCPAARASGLSAS